MRSKSRELIVIQSAYTYETLRKQGLLDFATSKNLNGYFARVITVHPAATLEHKINDRNRYGKLLVIQHSESFLFIEAKVGRFWHLRKFPIINFIISQIELILHLIRFSFCKSDLLIRGEDPRYNGALAFILSRINGLPLILGTWGNPDRIRKFLGKPLLPRIFGNVKLEESCERFLLKRADYVFVQNQDNWDYAVNYGADEKNIRLFRLGNAIHQSHFLAPEHRNFESRLFPLIAHQGFKICTISRLEKLKLVDHALKSFSLMKSASKSHLYIFGDGSEKGKLLELARDLGIEDRVHLLGNVNQDVLAQLLPKMDLVLAPLIGRALTEVALAARAIVAYNVDCHPEIVKHKFTGILVKYEDIIEMASAGDFLLDNFNEAQVMGSNARRFALEFMNPEKLIREQKENYNEIFEHTLWNRLKK